MPDRDVIEPLGESLIQHGRSNDRVYLMKLARGEAASAPHHAAELAREQGYSKVFAKVPADCREAFDAAGYEVEASVPGFFDGREDGLFMSLFLDEARRDQTTPDRNEQVLAACRAKAAEPPAPPQVGALRHRLCNADDAEQMAALYARVFDSYPFPIDRPDYLRQTMITHIVYFGLWDGDRLVALSSAEMDRAAANVEMTDFATDKAFRGRGLARALLERMEAAMARDMRTAYTIARAASFGMNITFARMGYVYGGRLACNTQIGGRLEDMNVWYRPLAPPAGEGD